MRLSREDVGDIALGSRRINDAREEVEGQIHRVLAIIRRITEVEGRLDVPTVEDSIFFKMRDSGGDYNCSFYFKLDGYAKWEWDIILWDPHLKQSLCWSEKDYKEIPIFEEALPALLTAVADEYDEVRLELGFLRDLGAKTRESA